MRISTITVYEQSLNSLNRQQSEFLKSGLQIASGRKVVNPSDDPQAASLAIGVQNSKAVEEQYANARVSARNALSQEESVLGTTSEAITRARTLLVQARNGTLSDADRQSVGVELQGIYEALIGQANATDGNGHYLFGGYQDSKPPFEVDPVSKQVQYVGDNGSKSQQVDSTRLMPTVDNGQSIFKSSADADLFASLEASIGVLSQPVLTAADKANLEASLATASTSLEKSFDNVLSVRASVGARLNELDVLDAVGDNRQLNYAQVLSDRLDLDYNKAISDYTLRQIGLQAAQKTFIDVQKMSLFNQI